ncbi:CDP-glycerol glycerophosphotransferase family protein [Paenibacillus yanchengensis]|uniref:CDP-glycerol glycerophosphotransferase family protein n=1 Tax=Paenibacillus yanchengensis TaxID=2035833 RepID=A0ABW4YN13_9BACL
MENVILFGASEKGKQAFIDLQDEYNIVGFSDNNDEKWNQDFVGLKVLPPSELLIMSNCKIVIASLYSFEIAQQLQAMGIKKVGIYRRIESRAVIDEIDLERIHGLDRHRNICLVIVNHALSNVGALYKLVPEKYKEIYNITVCSAHEKQALFFEGYDFHKEILENRMIVLDENIPKQKLEDTLFYHLWHGVPLKALGYMQKEVVHSDRQHHNWNRFDVIGSYSSFYNVLLSASFGLARDKFAVTGMPRNDFLYRSDGKENLSELLEVDITSKKIIYLMPTYRNSKHLRQETGNKSWSNIFGMEVFDNSSFETFLRQNNLLIVMKVHPHEEEEVLPLIESMFSSHVYLVTSQMLISKNMDWYETLNAAELLITDYSSVYFDYLLLDRPVLFTPVDYEDYSQDRGFLLEPYDSWTPGPKVINQDELQEQLLLLLENKDYYQTERISLKNIIHYHQDGNSSERVWANIHETLNRR